VSEIELHQNTGTLHEQMDYAKAVSSANLLPQAYRGKPADIMLAVGLGQSMGLSPAESLYRIDVIQGKPTASAELIAANVRKAGHKLRFISDENSATAIIVRADDPEFEFKVTRDREWARAMGLDGKDNYKKQPGTMLQWRAITAVARLACPEALYGVAYTADEMADMPSQGTPANGLRGILQDAEPEREPMVNEQVTVLLNTSSKLAKAMYAGINDLGIADDERIPFIVSVIDRTIESTKELTEDEAREVLRHIDAVKQPVDPEIVEEAQS